MGLGISYQRMWKIHASYTNAEPGEAPSCLSVTTRVHGRAGVSAPSTMYDVEALAPAMHTSLCISHQTASRLCGQDASDAPGRGFGKKAVSG